MMSEPSEQIRPGAQYSVDGPAVHIENLTVTEPSVAAEARHWSTGQRGPEASSEEMVDADISAFVTQAMVVGSRAIAAAGGVQDTLDVQRLLADVETRTTESCANAAASTEAVTVEAAKTVERASDAARKALAEVGRTAKQSFADNVGTTRNALQEEINRLVGGDNPELLARIQPILDKFGRDLDTQAAKQMRELFERAAKQFDPDDPTSPIAKYGRELQKQQQGLTATLEKNHRALTERVDELATAIKVNSVAEQTAASMAQVTPLKGETYATGVNRLMQEIAVGLGDDYLDTSTTPGAIPRSKKGDGVLLVDDGTARVVLEMSDAKRRPDWTGYLDEAERNRQAVASLGLARTADELGGCSVRCYGSRRIVLAFDPAVDDSALLRTVVQVLRVGAIAASARRHDGEIETAEEKIQQAVELLPRVDGIKKTAGSIRQNAEKIDRECESVRTAIGRLLAQAQSALAGAPSGTSDRAA